MRPIPYLVCVLCVQDIAGWQEELALPSTTSGRRAQLEKEVREREEGYIQAYKSYIARYDRDLSQLRAALGRLGESLGHLHISYGMLMNQ